MKIGIISDLHGNYRAFTEAKKVIQREKIKTTFILGDIFGYYYDGLKILSDIMGWDNCHIILGNHDEIFLSLYNSKNKEKIKDYKEKYGSSIYDFFENVSISQINFMGGLSGHLFLNIDGTRYALFHGGPNDVMNQRIFLDDSLDDFENVNADVIFLGHTHHRMYGLYKSKIIINPGSLGQPRDGNKASMVIFDNNSKTPEFIDIEFEIDDLKKEIMTKDSEPDYLINVLDRIRRD